MISDYRVGIRPIETLSQGERFIAREKLNSCRYAIKHQCKYRLFPNPVFYLQAVNTAEFIVVVGDTNAFQLFGMSGDHRITLPYSSAALFQVHKQLRCAIRCAPVEWFDFKGVDEIS